MVYKRYCERCERKQIITEYELSELKPKIYLFGFSFFGGARFYTFREVLTFLGYRKKIVSGKCNQCGFLLIQCPYCGHKLSKTEVLKERCPNCEKKYYTFI